LNSRRGPSEVGTREKLFIGESDQCRWKIRVDHGRKDELLLPLGARSNHSGRAALPRSAFASAFPRNKISGHIDQVRGMGRTIAVAVWRRRRQRRGDSAGGGSDRPTPPERGRTNPEIAASACDTGLRPSLRVRSGRSRFLAARPWTRYRSAPPARGHP